jgi:transcriptional regulator with XRE-family HTH domain
MEPALTRPQDTGFGQLLREWRRIRGKSQFALALEAAVSPRHVSFVETGRARPSRQMVLTLATTLNVPLRERNVLLTAAGFAPIYRESGLESAELEPARKALELILRHQEPYPAVVMNRSWDIVTSNAAAQTLFGMLLSDSPLAGEAANVVRLVFHPNGLRPWIRNWEEVAGAMVQRVHREAVGGVLDDRTRALLQHVLTLPGVPSAWRSPDPTAPLQPLVPVHFERDALSLQFFSTVTTLGTPQDLTLEELRVECFFPADPETARRAEALRAT